MEGRENFHRYLLHERSLIQAGSRTLFFPWVGDRVMDTLVLWIAGRGLNLTREGVALVFDYTTPEAVETEIRKIVSEDPPDPVALARRALNKIREKFHSWLDEDRPGRGLCGWGAGCGGGGGGVTEIELT